VVRLVSVGVPEFPKSGQVVADFQTPDQQRHVKDLLKPKCVVQNQLVVKVAQIGRYFLDLALQESKGCLQYDPD
jgi:hypothetical protein